VQACTQLDRERGGLTEGTEDVKCWLVFFFKCGLLLKSLLNLLQHRFCSMFGFFGFEACGGLSSPTRDRTRPPPTACIGRQSLNHWTPREVSWCCCLRWRQGQGADFCTEITIAGGRRRQKPPRWESVIEFEKQQGSQFDQSRGSGVKMVK